MKKIRVAVFSARPHTSKAFRDEWYQLSWSGQNPWRVIELASMEAKCISGFDGEMHLTTSIYSQVKYLVKRKKIFVAIGFWLMAKKHRKHALHLRKYISSEARNPIDLEVLGAPEFLIATSVPVVGKLFKETAYRFLIEAINESWTNPVTKKENLEHAIILSKLYKLTGNRHYAAMIRHTTRLTTDMDENQLRRIAEHLGFNGNIQEMMSFLLRKP